VFPAVKTCLLTAFAQNGSAPKRLTIGVVLEGALGLAHIGVPRWFEQHHIPVDYISGNSMGALVGGMYATGKSPEELYAVTFYDVEKCTTLPPAASN
jgi:predicted acylesterase/phospholipase RssA